MVKDLVLEKGLPAAIDIERLVLGALLLDCSAWSSVRATLSLDDWALDKHRRIFAAMQELAEAGTEFDLPVLGQHLHGKGKLESVDGLSYLISLTEGLPKLYRLTEYCQIVRDKAALRRIIHQAQREMDTALLGIDPPQAIIASAASAYLSMQEVGRNGGAQTFSDYVTATGSLERVLNTSARPKGMATGYDRFDSMTGGLRAGELWILAARPAMGKSALAGNIAAHLVLDADKVVALFSLEMSSLSLWDRLLCSRARVDLSKHRNAYCNQEERYRLSNAASAFHESRLVIHDNSAATLSEILAVAQRTRQRFDALDLVIVDYLQLVAPAQRLKSRQEEVSAIARGLKVAAHQLACPILALAQLNREVDNRANKGHIPDLSNLRESGELEQAADGVAFLVRPEVYDRNREDLKGVANLIIGKQRNGPTGTVKLAFLHQFTRFESMATAEAEAPNG